MWNAQRGLATALASCALVMMWATPASVAHAESVRSVARRSGCTTAGVQGLARQLIKTQRCMTDYRFVRFDDHPNVTLTSSRVHPFVQGRARRAIHRAADRRGISVNSAFRTLVEQYVLYHSGACGLAAPPGSSNHQSGRAIDVANWSGARSALESAGCSWFGSSDAVHFDCPGGDKRSDAIKAFQRLWNINHPGDRIAVDGDYGPATARRLGDSPAGGFSRGGCCRPHCKGDVVVRGNCSRKRCDTGMTCTGARGPRCIDKVCSDHPLGVHRKCVADKRLRVCRNGHANRRRCRGPDLCRARQCVDPECPRDGSRATLCASDGRLLLCDGRNGPRLACGGDGVCTDGRCSLEACVGHDGRTCLDAWTMGECADGKLVGGTPCPGGCLEDGEGTRCEPPPCEEVDGAICVDDVTLGECAGGSLVATEPCDERCGGPDGTAQCDPEPATDPGSGSGELGPSAGAGGDAGVGDGGVARDAGATAGGCAVAARSRGPAAGSAALFALLLLHRIRRRAGHPGRSS